MHPRGRPKQSASNEAISKTATVAAKLVGVSTSTVERALRVETSPDLTQQVRAGTMTYSRADSIVRNRERDRQRAKVKTPKSIRTEVRLGDFRDVLGDLHNVDAVICDPPYARDALPLFADLAVWADKLLKPDGVLVVMSGAMFLPEVMRQLDGYRPYRWTMACVGARMQSVYNRRVSQQWKPILVYGGGPRIVGDVVRYETSETTSDHEHGQDFGVFQQLISKLTKPGETIVDPFSGVRDNPTGGAIPRTPFGRLRHRQIKCDHGTTKGSLTVPSPCPQSLPGGVEHMAAFRKRSYLRDHGFLDRERCHLAPSLKSHNPYQYQRRTTAIVHEF